MLFRSSSDNDIAEHDDDDIDSSDHDDQEQAQAPTAHDNMIAASSVMNDMLDAEQEQEKEQQQEQEQEQEEEQQQEQEQEEEQQQEQEQEQEQKQEQEQEQAQMLEEELKAGEPKPQQRSTYEEFKNKLSGPFDFSKNVFTTLPEYPEAKVLKFDISPIDLSNHIYDNRVFPEQVFTVLSTTPIDYLEQLQEIGRAHV